jgi:hydroxyacylglutathione hydrolase
MNLLELSAFESAWDTGAIIIDTRNSIAFTDGFVEDSISLPFTDTFLETFNNLVEPEDHILVIAEEKDITEIDKTLKKSGFFNIKGYLKGGFATWKDAGKPIDLLITVDAEEFAIDYNFDEFYLVDVRDAEAFEEEHLEFAENIGFIDLNHLLPELETDERYYVYGNTVEEAVSAGSMFKKYGLINTRSVVAPYSDIKTTSIPLVGKKKKGNKDSFSKN